MSGDAQAAARSLQALRARHRLGTLSPLVVAVMSEVDSDWFLSRHDISWNAFLAVLDCFILREGHARVPQNCSEGGYPLGARVNTIRKAWIAGRLSAARAEQVSGRAGWAWSADDVAWDNFLAVLDCFILREGHARVPARHFEGEFPLGARVNNTRTTYKAGRLNAARAVQVSGRAGWAWSAHEVAWGNFLAVLDCFILREGHARVPARHFEGEYPLGARVSTTRTEWRSGSLSVSRQEQVSARAGWMWEPLRGKSQK
jgi:hypothetical protein